MAVQARRNINNEAFVLSGTPLMREDETIAQDATRAIPLAPKTVMVRTPGATTWQPLRALLAAPGTPAILACGVNGNVIGDWDGIANGTFAIGINGVATNIGPLDFNTVAVTTFEQCAMVIDNAVAAHGLRCSYDRATNVFTFFGASRDIHELSLLTATGAGTDISGVAGPHGYLNGNHAVGVDATDFEQSIVPAGIYIGDEIAAATIVAGTVPNCPIIVGGNITLDLNQIVLEAGLLMMDVIVPLERTIADALGEIGIWPEDTLHIANYENV
jgi:hypothetical protein